MTYREPLEPLKVDGIPSRLIAAVRIIARRRQITYRQAVAEALDAYTAGIVGAPSADFQRIMADADRLRKAASDATADAHDGSSA